MDCSPPGCSVHGDSPGTILEWVAMPPPRDLPNPGVELGLLHWRCILYQLSSQGSPITKRRWGQRRLLFFKAGNIAACFYINGNDPAEGEKWWCRKREDNSWRDVLEQKTQTEDLDRSTEKGCVHACVLSPSVVSDSCGPSECGPPGASVHGVFQARILEWVAISYCRGSRPRDQTHLSCIGRQILYHWATWDTNCLLKVTELLPTPFIKRIFFYLKQVFRLFFFFFFPTCTLYLRWTYILKLLCT